MSTRVQREAHAVLQRGGYFQPSAVRVYITCPRCKDEVTAHVVAWAKPVARCRALEEALVVHWEDCQTGDGGG